MIHSFLRQYRGCPVALWPWAAGVSLAWACTAGALAQDAAEDAYLAFPEVEGKYDLLEKWREAEEAVVDAVKRLTKIMKEDR